MWQLVYGDLAGGRKGVPDSVADDPQVFATVAAPSFGPVHTAPATTAAVGAVDTTTPKTRCWRGDRPGYV